MSEEETPPVGKDNDSDAEIEYLVPWVRETVFFIVRYHGVAGNIPSNHDILEYLNLTKKFAIEPDMLEGLKTNEGFLKSMAVRGLQVNTAHGELRAVTNLSPRQTEAVATMLNYVDRRSDEKKLRDIGVSSEEWATWMQDNKFVQYMHGRAETLMANSIHEAHMGLIRGSRQGNTASIKLLYEITGRHDPNAESQVNVRMLIGRVLEAIQKHVQDSDTLNRLAVELSQIAIESTSSPVGKTTESSELSTGGIKGEIEAMQEVKQFNV